MKTSILIVDDEADIRERAKFVLGSDRYELTEAKNLAELRLALAGPATDLVLLDLMLPDGHALGVLPELNQAWPATRVIIVTGHGTVAVAEEAYKVDPRLFLLSKPFDSDTLRALVELALADKPAGTATTDEHR